MSYAQCGVRLAETRADRLLRLADELEAIAQVEKFARREPAGGGAGTP
ncbi:MAG: hypothetical protein V3R29_08570 [Candidatus Acidoferrales bacterium]